MKLKKFFAGVLAAAMMLTVGATAAFATAPAGTDEAATANLNSFENGKTEFTTSTPIYLYKEYQVVNGISPEETFSFNINYVGVVQDDTAHYKPNVSAGKVGDPKTISFNAITGPKTEANSFSVTLADLGFNNTITGTGKYLYTITESKGNTAATSYDSRTLYMLVNVAHNVDQNGKILDGYTFYITLGHKWNENAKKM